MNRAKSLGLVGAITASLVAVPAVAQAQGPSYCNLVTPTVRDVVQEAPAVAAVLNLDPALPDQTIIDQRNRLGCGELPAQTEDEARGELCAVLSEARVEELVAELDDPNATRGLESVRPALGIIIEQSRDQLGCDAAGAPVGSPAPDEADDPVSDDDGAADGDDAPVVTEDGAVDADGDGVATDKHGNQVVVIPRGSADTGDGSYTA